MYVSKEYHDKGHENDEVFDHVNEEEQGQYELKNYRQPIKVSTGGSSDFESPK